jgi:predicted  nucleic acid-binding Zn-ribbon protein
VVRGSVPGDRHRMVHDRSVEEGDMTLEEVAVLMAPTNDLIVEIMMLRGKLLQAEREIARLQEESATWKEHYEASEQAHEGTVKEFNAILQDMRGYGNE